MHRWKDKQKEAQVGYLCLSECFKTSLIKLTFKECPQVISALHRCSLNFVCKGTKKYAYVQDICEIFLKKNKNANRRWQWEARSASLVDGALHLQFRGRRMAPTGYKAMRRGYFNNNINNMIQQHCARNNTARAQGDYYLTTIRDN